KLFPTIDNTTIQSLYLLCDLYLDINEGNEIENAVRKAFDFNLLILTYTDISHNLFVTASPHRFQKSHNAYDLNKFIQSIYADTDFFNRALKLQHNHANGISIRSFNNVMD